MIRSKITLRPAYYFNFAAAVLSLVLLLSLAACGPESVDPQAPSVPSPLPGPTAAPDATKTGPPPPAPTATLPGSPTVQASASPAAQTGCEFEYFFEPAPDTCPAAPPASSAAAEQPFEGGVLIWLELTGSIIVLHDDGRWQRFDDTWTEEQPESDPSLVPPDGRFQPIRGFGKVWRERPEVRDALGWALGVELGFESTLQDQATAAGRPEQTFLRTYNGQVFALIKRDPDEGEWVIAADNR